MKKIVLMLLACFSALAICSCNQQKPNEQFDFGGSETPSPYFFTGILKPKSLKIITNNGNGYGSEKSDYTSLLLMLSGDTYGQFSEATFDEFKKLASKIGDTESKDGYYHATPVDNQTTESAISEVTIKSLSRYNESHPEGSSLKEIIRINYQSFDHVFNKALKPTVFGSAHHAMYTVEPSEDFTQVKHPALIMGTYVGAREYKDGLAMSIEFLQAPSIATQHLQVTLLFENGIKLTKDITVDILEIKK